MYPVLQSDKVDKVQPERNASMSDFAPASPENSSIDDVIWRDFWNAISTAAPTSSVIDINKLHDNIKASLEEDASDQKAFGDALQQYKHLLSSLRNDNNLYELFATVTEAFIALYEMNQNVERINVLFQIIDLYEAGEPIQTIDTVIQHFVSDSPSEPSIAPTPAGTRHQNQGRLPPDVVTPTDVSDVEKPTKAEPITSTQPDYIPGGGEKYIVQQGDSLGKIAKTKYQDSNKWQVIWKATNAKAQSDSNFKHIENPNSINIGQWLWIPEIAPRPVISKRNFYAKRFRDARVWSRRFTSLREAIAETKKVLKVDDELSNNLGQMLDYMSAFAADTFGFFNIGFQKDPAVNSQDSRLSRSKQYPPNYVRRTLLRQISTDLNLVQQVIQQRSFAGEVSTQKNILDMADKLAHQALQPAIDHKLLKADTLVITYLQKDVQIRLIPYDRIMFVGVPFATLPPNPGPSTDYLTLPHEIGHHLYWHGKIGDTFVYEVIRSNLKEREKLSSYKIEDWHEHWLEELFADAYGCLIAGPISVLGFQEVLADNPPEHFTEDLDKHPIPALRPLIQTKMIRQLNKAQGRSLEQVPDILDQHWQNWVENYLNNSQALGKQDILNRSYKLRPNKTYKGQKILHQLTPVIETIYNILSDINTEPWTEDHPEISSLEQSFTAKVFPPYAINAFRSHTDDEHPWQTLKQKLEEKKNEQLSVDDWVNFFQIRGWSTEHAEKGTIAQSGTGQNTFKAFGDSMQMKNRPAKKTRRNRRKKSRRR